MNPKINEIGPHNQKNFKKWHECQDEEVHDDEINKDHEDDENNNKVETNDEVEEVVDDGDGDGDDDDNGDDDDDVDDDENVDDDDIGDGHVYDDVDGDENVERDDPVDTEIGLAGSSTADDDHDIFITQSTFTNPSERDDTEKEFLPVCDDQRPLRPKRKRNPRKNSIYEYF